MTSPSERNRVWSRERALYIGGLLLICALVVAACSRKVGASASARADNVLLVPEVNAGWVGWCIGVRSQVGGCPLVRSAPPVIAETWTVEGDPPAAQLYALTARNVTAVSLNGVTIATRPGGSLPDGLRAVSVEVKAGQLHAKANGRLQLPRFVPLDIRGNALPQGPRTEHNGTLPLGEHLGTRRLRNPAAPEFGPSRIETRRVRGLRMLGGSEIAAVRSSSGLIGKGFLSCASASYTLDGWPVLAGILLNAERPGAPPPPLPEMQPVAGHPGVFEAPSTEGFGSAERLVARRLPGAWLVVERAQLSQRLALLDQLHAAVHL